MSRRVVSVLHHSFPLVEGREVEEYKGGWHYVSARALARIGGYHVVTVRPGRSRGWRFLRVDDVNVIVSPRGLLSSRLALGEYSHGMAGMVESLAREGYLPYIHEYHAIESLLLVRRLLDYPVILQHHGRPPPRRAQGKRWGYAWGAFKSGLEKVLSRVQGAFFVLNLWEKEYLEDVLGVEAMVTFRTMGADFEEINVPSIEEKLAARERLGLPRDTILLLSYVEVMRGSGEEKGAHFIPRIWWSLKNAYGEKVGLVVRSSEGPYAEALKRLGVRVLPRLPRDKYLDLLKAIDIYFLPAPSGYYLGPGVVLMEAMAAGKLVVTPSLLGTPLAAYFKDTAVIAPFISGEKNLREFINALAYAIDNVESFNPHQIRAKARTVFSWESFVADFDRVARKL